MENNPESKMTKDEVTMTPVIDTGVSKTALGSDGIIYFEYHPGAVEDADEVRKYVDAIRKATAESGKTPMLVDLTNVRTVTREARQLHASPEISSLHVAYALVTKNPVSRTIGNFFLRMSPPEIPTRMFGDREEAREWLLSKM